MIPRRLVQFLLSFSFAVSWCASGFAAESNPTLQPAGYAVRADVDGDQVPDKAQVSELDNDYILSIDLSSDPSWTELQTCYTSDPVIAVEAMDVDGDHDRDIVLVGLNPFKPSGLWLNEGAKGFRSEIPWLAANFQKQSGARLIRLTFESVDSDPGSLDEPGPDADVPHYILPSIVKIEVRVLRQPQDVLFSVQSSNVPLRGPPSSL